jgi:hypothetical protein
MIRKLIVLNGSEGHKFEVGNQYANSETQIVEKITILGHGGYRVYFESKDFVDVMTDNVLVFSTM